MEETKIQEAHREESPAVRQLVDFFMRAAQDKLKETRWFKTCPDTSKIQLSLKGVETRDFWALIGNHVETPVLVVIASDGVEETEILFRLDQIT